MRDTKDFDHTPPSIRQRYYTDGLYLEMIDRVGSHGVDGIQWLTDGSVILGNDPSVSFSTS